MQQTSVQFDKVIAQCKEIFLKKTADYGTSWRILRAASITDQLFIKASRIRGIEEKGTHLIDEGIEPEFIGIVNYGIMGLIQLEGKESEKLELELATADVWYTEKANEIKNLMMLKNHDYGEAWRDMRISSFTDMILVRLLRIKQIEDNKGATLISEGIDANYMDIVNYAIFALIKIDEQKA
jgi:hypothetical protein